MESDAVNNMKTHAISLRLKNAQYQSHSRVNDQSYLQLPKFGQVIFHQNVTMVIVEMFDS